MMQDRWKTLHGLWLLRRDRALTGALEHLKPETSLDLVRRLERQGMAIELDLDVPNWRVESILKSRTIIAPAQTITIPAQGDDFPEEAHGWPEFSARVLANVHLDVDSALVFAGDRVIAQSGTGTRAARDAAFVSGAAVRVSRQQPSKASGPIAPLGDVHHHYHVMLETLPRMLHARAAQPDVTFVTSAPIHQRYRVLFEELGLTIETHPRGTVLASDDLVLVDQPDLFWPRPADIDVVRQALGGEAASRTHSELIYVGRRASARSIIDESALENHLVERGFRSVHLEEMSIRDQVGLFTQALGVVAPHGAGLAGIAFLRPGARVIEFTSGEFFEHCYRRVAIYLDIDYRLVRIPADETAPFGRGHDAAPVLDRQIQDLPRV